jgi:ubiquinol-cytochrome c reductase cytochrome b subunit
MIDRLNTTGEWIDSRMPLVGPTKSFFAHPVNRFENILDLMGELTLFLFVNQLITGVLLAMFYRPSDAEVGGSFASIKSIMETVPFGSLVRGLHYYGAQAMVITIFFHIGRVFWLGAYKKPRELTWLLGVGLFLTTLAFAFTGYLLPWNQEAYWATMVGTAIPGYTPVIGGYIVGVMRSGAALTGDTISRFYSVHMLLLPGTLITLLIFHLALTIKQGVSFLTEEWVDG